MKTMNVLMSLSFKKLAMFGLIGSMSFVMTACNNGSSKSNVPGVVPANGIPTTPRNNQMDLNGQLQTANGNINSQQQDVSLANLLLKKEAAEAEKAKASRDAVTRAEDESRIARIAAEKMRRENLALAEALNKSAAANSNNPCMAVDPCGRRVVVTPPVRVVPDCPPTKGPCGVGNGNGNGSTTIVVGPNRPGTIVTPCPPTKDDPCGNGNSNNNGNNNGSDNNNNNNNGNQQVITLPVDPCDPCGSKVVRVVVATDEESLKRTIELGKRTEQNLQELADAKKRLDEQAIEIANMQKELARIEASKKVVCCEKTGTEQSTVVTRTETITRTEVVETQQDGVIVRIAKGIGDAISGIGRFLFGSSERREPAPVETREIVTVREAKESCDEAQVQLETMKEAVKTAETKLTTAIAERDQARLEVTDLKQNSVPKEQVAEIARKLAESDAALAAKNAEVEALNEKLRQANAEIAKLKAAGASKVAGQNSNANGPKANKPAQVTAQAPAAKATDKSGTKVVAKPGSTASAQPTKQQGKNCVKKSIEVCEPEQKQADVVADLKGNDQKAKDQKPSGETVDASKAAANDKVITLLSGKLSVSSDLTSEIKPDASFAATNKNCSVALDKRTTPSSASGLSYLQFVFQNEAGTNEAKNLITDVSSFANLNQLNIPAEGRVYGEFADKKTLNGKTIYVINQCVVQAKDMQLSGQTIKVVRVICRETNFKDKEIGGLKAEGNSNKEIYLAGSKLLNAQARIDSTNTTTFEMYFSQDKLVDVRVRTELRDHSKGDATKLAHAESKEMLCR